VTLVDERVVANILKSESNLDIKPMSNEEVTLIMGIPFQSAGIELASNPQFRFSKVQLWVYALSLGRETVWSLEGFIVNMRAWDSRAANVTRKLGSGPQNAATVAPWSVTVGIQNYGGIITPQLYNVGQHDASLARMHQFSQNERMHLKIDLSLTATKWVSSQRFSQPEGTPLFVPGRLDESYAYTTPEVTNVLEGAGVGSASDSEVRRMMQSRFAPGMSMVEAAKLVACAPLVHSSACTIIDTGIYMPTLLAGVLSSRKCDCKSFEGTRVCSKQRCIHAIVGIECNNSICSFGEYCSNRVFTDLCLAEVIGQARILELLASGSPEDIKLLGRTHPNVEMFNVQMNGISQLSLIAKRDMLCDEPILTYGGILVRAGTCLGNGRVLNQYTMGVSKDLSIDGAYGGSWGQLMNHSCEPSASAVVQVIGGLPTLCIIAGAAEGGFRAPRCSDDITINYTGIPPYKMDKGQSFPTRTTWKRSFLTPSGSRQEGVLADR